ncbi:hypothetical protein LOC67_03875 [Stieleria sp. JC731]|uniref:hypothetical protein n=1 Tax=Pirellulaceae TaxID=2691357 RepID=UPI001E4FC122|nr:hypothetical protein [Stieleria sp. JC731]MCC9599689.1 hypothetical protein [Stieleria sp. JC731]
MFDPLHKWLGIPPSEQPPNDYRLLGLSNFESDPEVIDAAADRDLSFLHDLSSGEHGDEAEELANRISAARLRLLNPEKKAAYDEQLREDLRVEEIDVDVDAVLQSFEATMQADEPAITEASPRPNLSAGSSPADILGMGTRSPDASPPEIPSAPRANPGNIPPVPGISPVRANQRAGEPITTNAKPRRKSRGSKLTWLIGVLPGTVILAVLLFKVYTGQLLLDQKKLESLGVSSEHASALAGMSQSEDPSNQPETDSTESTDASSGQASTNTPSQNQPHASPRISQLPPNANTSTANRQPPSMNSSSITLSTPGNRPTTPPTSTISNNSPASPTLRSLPGMPSGFPAAPWEIPSGEALEAKKQIVRELYQDQYDKAKTDEQLIALADEMYAAAVQTNDDPAGKYALLTALLKIYIQGSDLQSGLETLNRMADSFGGVEIEEQKLDAFQAVKPSKRNTRVFCFYAIENVTDAIRSGRIDVARRTMQMIENDVSRVPIELRGVLKDVAQQLQYAESLMASYEQSGMTLESDPDDAAAMAITGRYLIMVEDRWNEGLPYLAQGNDPLFKTAAQAELKQESGETVPALQIADQWFDIIEQVDPTLEKFAVAARAKEHYVNAESKESTIERLKIKNRIAVLDSILNESPLQQLQLLRSNLPDNGRSSRTTRAPSSTDRAEIQNPHTFATTRNNLAAVSPDKQQLKVGMGPNNRGGEAMAGVELQNCGTIDVAYTPSHTTVDTTIPTSLVGFVIDYKVGAGYVKRVFVKLSANALPTPAKLQSQHPHWGTGRRPQLEIQRNLQSTYTFDLEQWAPLNWNGECCFSIYMRDAGLERAFTATLRLKARQS